MINKYKVTLSLDQDILNYINNNKKDIKLSTYINDILREWLDYQLKGGSN